jgi:hypothetical protein
MNPTKEQTSEMEEVTKLTGGVRPLHMKNLYPSKPVEKQEVQETEEKPKEETENKEENFEFPEGGWECSKCQNYNFKGRKACFRCKKAKADDDFEGKPEHMIIPQQKQRRFKKHYEDESSMDTYEYSKDNRVHKFRAAAKPKPKKDHNQERVGDWTCQRCFNHNFSFRDVCNMCYLSHTESNKMLYIQQQNRFMVSQGMNTPMP